VEVNYSDSESPAASTNSHECSFLMNRPPDWTQQRVTALFNFSTQTPSTLTHFFRVALPTEQRFKSYLLQTLGSEISVYLFGRVTEGDVFPQ
jgi:hypothetical protein